MEKDKILVIDDSAVQVEFLHSILKDSYQVTTCQTSAEGLRLAREGGFSLILLDVVMPDMDGFILIRELKDAELTRHVPVIMITSLAEAQYEEKGLLLGAVDYIAKPFNPTIVRARVNTHIQLYRYQTQFRELAMIDQLSGVANRRRYDVESAARWQDAARFGLSFSVCMFDIDRFKLYNDTFGHPAGDQVIAAVAKTASARFRRATDLFARYGGEEFSAVFMGSTPLAAFDFLKDVRQAIEDLHIPHSPEAGEWVTVSIGGVTVTPRPGDDYITFLKLADTMLYDAKRLGRNRVVWSDGGKTQWVEK